jgi:hypothetical protein
MPALAKKREQYPSHEYADQHKLLIARAEFVTSKRRLRDASTLRPSAEVACERIREYCWDLRELELSDLGDHWRAECARRIGMWSDEDHSGYGVLLQVISGSQQRVSTRTVDRIARATGIPVRVFYDPEI